MTKSEFINRLAKGRLAFMRKDSVEKAVDAVFQEIKDVVREGDELHINTFGRIYPKAMNGRLVKGGWKHDNQHYSVPPKIKIGLSSFTNADSYVSDQTGPSTQDGMYSDVLDE